MYYVSSVDENSKKYIPEWGVYYYNKIGITDTKDGVEEFLDNKTLYKLLRDSEGNKTNIKVYGTDVYGLDKYRMFVFVTPMRVNISLSTSKFEDLVQKNKQKHNGFSLLPIADYMASAKSYTVIEIRYAYEAHGRYFNSMSTFEKLGEDSWYYTDDGNSFSNTRMDSYEASHFVDVATCSGRVKGIRIYEEKV